MAAANVSVEYMKLFEAMKTMLNEGYQPDPHALNALRNAHKTLEICKHGKILGKRKHRGGAIGAALKERRQHVLVAIWKKILYPYTLPAQYEQDGFERKYAMHGAEGYKNLLNDMGRCMREIVEKEEDITRDEIASLISDFEKPGGFVEHLALNFAVNLWDKLESNLDEAGAVMLGVPGLYTHRRDLLAKWSKELAMAKSESNVKYASKVVQFGEIGVEVADRGTRPSRVVLMVRSIHFLRREQVSNLHRIGSGIQGHVFICHILDCPLIPRNATLVAKRFKDGDRHKRRTDALQEVLMGGLNHKGIIGALAMTIEDPPKLIYDHYNGGDLGSFIDKCGKWSKSKGKTQSTSEVDVTFISEKKLFLEHRLGIAMALLETLQYLHAHDRFHCDLHFGNILLHFDHGDDLAIRVYVGICDFGLSKHKSQCTLPQNRMWPTPTEKAVAYQKQSIRRHRRCQQLAEVKAEAQDNENRNE